MSSQQLINDLSDNRARFFENIRKNPELLKKLDEKTLRKLFLESVERKDMNTIEMIVEHGVNLDIDPLELALARGDLKSVESLLSRGKKIKDIRWPLSLLANCMFYKIIYKDILLILFEYDLDPKIQDSQDRNLLHYFSKCARGQKADVVEEMIDILLNAGISVHDTDEEGSTSLTYAVEKGNLELIEILIKKGADVHHKDVEERTLLHLAASYYSYTDVFNFLISKGVDVHARDDIQETALHVACYFHDEKKVDLLIQKGADLNALDCEDETPFAKIDPGYVFNFRYNECLKLMVKKFSSMNFENISISETNMGIIQADVDVRKLFEECKNELTQLSSLKYYRNHTYYSLLKTSKNVKILAKLTENEEFLKKFKTVVCGLCCFKSDLQKILKDAIEYGEKSKAVLSRLDTAFDDFLPDVVKRKLENYLSLEDLPLE